MANQLQLLPAIDISNGHSVRVSQNRIDQEGEYGSPIETASHFAAVGASWIHLVDLDQAFSNGNNHELIAEVIESQPNIQIQLSGGIKNQETLDFALATKAKRINLSTAALIDLTWVANVVAEYGERVVVGLDVLGDRLDARGESVDVGNLFEVLIQLEQLGVQRYLVTDVNKDGMLQGPNLDLLKAVLAKSSKPVVASGGVSSLQDIEALKSLVPMGLEGLVLGKALYEGNFTLEQALEVAG
jgi:1-(5-phosphoribosyl)-5-[(5-phosphoribosylamino)methylideneamino] imidazole-4-carboxamide isomerase/N-(5'phosphoribosyl)anthranilate isomerase